MIPIARRASAAALALPILIVLGDLGRGLADRRDPAGGQPGAAQELPVDTQVDHEPEAAGARTSPGTVFRDCPACPEMVVVPAGSFMMGSPESEEGRQDDEGPRHLVTIGSLFAAGVYEVTFVEWDACVEAGGCGGYHPDDEGWGRGTRPVIHVHSSRTPSDSMMSWGTLGNGRTIAGMTAMSAVPPTAALGYRGSVAPV